MSSKSRWDRRIPPAACSHSHRPHAQQQDLHQVSSRRKLVAQHAASSTSTRAQHTLVVCFLWVSLRTLACLNDLQACKATGVSGLLATAVRRVHSNSLYFRVCMFVCVLVPSLLCVCVCVCVCLPLLCVAVSLPLLCLLLNTDRESDSHGNQTALQSTGFTDSACVDRGCRGRGHVLEAVQDSECGCGCSRAPLQGFLCRACACACVSVCVCVHMPVPVPLLYVVLVFPTLDSLTLNHC